MEIWHILVSTAILAFTIEIFTAGFISASVAIGLLLAATGNYLGLEVEWQILLFSLGLTISFFLIRPIITKYGYKETHVQTNRDALIAKKGTVTEEINEPNNTGRISIDGDDWKAKSSNKTIIKKGTIIKVIDVESIILIVEELN